MSELCNIMKIEKTWEMKSQTDRRARSVREREIGGGREGSVSGRRPRGSPLPWIIVSGDLTGVMLSPGE